MKLFKRKAKTNDAPMCIIGLVAPSGIGAHKSGDAYYWQAGTWLYAWKEKTSDRIHHEKIRLEHECDFEGIHALQKQVHGNAVIEAKVQRNEEGFTLIELVQNDIRDDALRARLMHEEAAK